MNILCPPEMALPVLASQKTEDIIHYSTLAGLFAAYRNGDLDRPALTGAIRSWQITEAREALHGIQS
jgi:hypothetical protein